MSREGSEAAPSETAQRSTLLARLTARELPLVVRLVRLAHHRPLRLFMLAATRGADGWALLVLVPLCFVIGGSLGQVAVLLGAVSGVTTAFLVSVLKRGFDRARPGDVDHPHPIAAPDRHAFPSGHTAQAFSVLMVATWLHPLFGFLLAPLSASVGISRVFFGLHFPSDVAAGGLIGSLVALAWAWGFEALGLTAWILRIGPLG